MKFFHRSIIMLFFLLPLHAGGQVISLEGPWKFHVGDKSFWSIVDFDDSKWGTIQAPSPWEEQGFNNYDGFAWYRRKFDGRKLLKQESYYIGLGFIDDCDEVYVNGKLIGFSGSMPPKFKTAYNKEREYKLPAEVINYTGDNLIAIRVFDVVHGGGLIDGRLGIYRREKHKLLSIDLEGIWFFVTSKNDLPAPKDAEWEKLMVPGTWDQQGYSSYDGFAWYRKTFSAPADLDTDDLLLLMGKIDDFDKVYLNGQLIGSTNDHKSYGRSTSYDKTRAYPIPQGLLKKSGTNTIEVLVEDMGDIGGFRDGPVGVATRENYERHFKR